MLRRTLLLFILSNSLFAASKPHGVVFGKWIAVKWMIGPEESQPVDLKVRPLIVDGKIKEYVTGPSHEITERLFVVRRAFKVNDNLPDEMTAVPQWQWQRGGWLLVDRMTGHSTRLVLPDYDLYYSAIAWYRDYAAYCGVSEDGKRLMAVVAQIGRRQPVLRKMLGEPVQDDEPDTACAAPLWQRKPARVTFETMNAPRFTYAIRGHAATVVEEQDMEEAVKQETTSVNR
jgi:hypothetical protein